MKKLSILGAIVVAIITTSCSITLPVAASGAAIGDKVGESSTVILFGIQLNKSYGVVEAARVGGIKGSVAIVDEKTTNYAGLFIKKTLIVNGK